MNIHKLKSAGIDYEQGCSRFSANVAMYEKFLSGFLQDQSYDQLCTALKQGDLATAFQAAHTLKGLAGNLSINRFYECLCPVVELLRAKQAPLQEDMDRLEQEYNEIKQVLQ